MGKWHLCLRYPLWSSDHTPGMLCPPTESYQTNQLLLHRWTRRREKTYAQISRAIGSLVEQPSLSSAESSYLFLCISVGKWHPQVQIRGDNVGTLFIRRFLWPFRLCLSRRDKCAIDRFLNRKFFQRNAISLMDEWALWSRQNKVAQSCKTKALRSRQNETMVRLCLFRLAWS